MAKIVEALRRDHINMARILDALERQLVIFDQARTPDYEIIQAILEYCLNYPDLHHHPTEDMILGKLEERGAATGQEFGDLRSEHQVLGDLTRKFAGVVRNVLQEAEMPREAFQKIAREFLEFYRHHISQEERAFFPTALKTLSDQDWAEIAERLQHREDPVFGARAEERFKSLRENILNWDGAA